MIDIYLCDKDGVRTRLLQNITDYIVTDRAQDHSDFQFSTPDRSIMDYIRPGTLVETSLGDTLYELETIRGSKDAEGKTSFKFEGREISCWLEKRPAVLTYDALIDYIDKVDSTNREILALVLDAGNAEDPFKLDYKVTYKDLQNWYPSKQLEYKLPRKSKWEVLQELIKAYHLGIKTKKMYNKWGLDVTFYPLVNRTGITIQGYDHKYNSKDDVVMFSHAREDFITEDLFWSIKDYSNVALSFGDHLYTRMYRMPKPLSHQARVIFKDNSGIAPEKLDVRSKIEYERSYTRLQAESMLAETEPDRVVSFQLSPKTASEYGVMYNLGDIVLVDSELLPGVDAVPMVVSEYTSSYNDSGFSAYPTLTELSSLEGTEILA